MSVAVEDRRAPACPPRGLAFSALSARLIVTRRLIGIVLPAWMAFGFLAAQPQEASLPEIDQIARSEVERQKLVGLGLGTVVEGEIRHLQGYGFEDREAGIPVRPNLTMFRWASVAKTLTAVIAVKLASDGRLDLDAPIEHYMEDYKVPATWLKACGDAKGLEWEGQSLRCHRGFFEIPLTPEQRSITARRLLGHLGGIMHYSNGRSSPLPRPMKSVNDPETNTGVDWALLFLFDKPLVAIPGERFSYTTFGFNLAGAVLQRAGGKPFAELLQQEIAAPLELKTLQPDYEWKEIPHRAVGYSRGRRQGSEDVSWKLPGGGVVSTVGELTNYCRALTGDDFLTPREKELLWTRQKTGQGEETSYGLGFGVSEVDGQTWVSHSGSQQKTRTFMLLVPEVKTCVTVMTNSVDGDPQTIARKVYLRLKESR